MGEGDSLAHYLWPLQWVGAAPKWAFDDDEPVLHADLAEIVLERKLGDEMRLRVYRDGMLLFRLGSWGDKPHMPRAGAIARFDAQADYEARCVRMLNAHLACLNSTSRQGHTATVLTPEDVMEMRWEDCLFLGGGGARGFEPYHARVTHAVMRHDWRFRRSFNPTNPDEIVASVKLFRRLLARPQQDLALLRAELLLRAVAAYGDHDYSSALVHAWTATEGLMTDALMAYVDQTKGRKTDTAAEFMDDKRRAFFQQNSEVTARITAELLSLGKRIPLSLYEGIIRDSQNRNYFLHGIETKKRKR